MTKILMVATEGLPFIKTGGLADVIGSLPKELLAKGHDVRIVLPLYKKIAAKWHDKFTFEKTYYVNINYEETQVNLYSYVYEELTYYFIEHQGYFEREALYGYEDDGERFAYFQKAVLEMLNQLDFFPEIMHCHDWHTGMIACMCKENFNHDWRYRGIKHVYTIHNLAFQGNFGPAMLDSCLGLGSYVFDNGNVRFDGGISFMKTAIVYSDKITTVSPNYAEEIKTTQYGERLESVLRFREADLCGVVNGIDEEMWNPAKDPLIAKNYNARTFRSGKKANKVALQEKLGLDVDENVMMLGLVSRLTWQKGIYLIIEQLFNIINQPIQLVVLGSGEAGLEEKLREAEANNKGKVAFYCGYNEALAHEIYAASDLFLMPSLFEPCGLSQMISMRYGSLPLVRETGGLKDTVPAYNPATGEGVGFSFTNYNSNDMMHVLWEAIDLYYNDKNTWKTIVRAAMAKDVSWRTSAELYIGIYNELTGE